LRDNIYMLEGLGGNVGLSVGEDGAFIIDNQFPELSEKILAAIRKITDKEIRFVINTHHHGDHTGGNEYFAKMGALIFAHENVHKILREGTINRQTGKRNPPPPKETLPIVTFQNQLNLYLNGEAVRVIHVAPAHTNGDSFIYFSESDVIHSGDFFVTHHYPFIDVTNGGRILGIIEALNRLIEVAGPDTKIIPGHGKLSNEAGAIDSRDMFVDIRNRISKLISEGKSLEQVIAAKPTTDYDDRWMVDGTTRRDRFISTIYNELIDEK